MQDIQPDVVTAEQLVNEILRRQSSGGPGGCGTGNKPPLGHDLDLSSEDDPITDLCDDSRRGSMTKAMSIEEVEEDEEPGCAAFANSKSCPSSPLSEVVILDCQNPTEFQECHIRGSINVTFPAIMIRRIAAGKIDIFEKSKELKARIANSRMTFVVYDSFNSTGSGHSSQNSVTVRSIVPPASITSSSAIVNFIGTTTGAGDGGNGSIASCPAGSNCSASELSDLVNLIARKLAQNGCRVATLTGGLPLFRELFPEWIESPETKRHATVPSASNSSSAESSPDPSRPGEVPLLGLGSLASLKIQDDPDACDSCIGLEGDDAFPVEILPNLYLGNASISSDLPVLEMHSIKHILNVTPDLPNVFEDSMRYLQIPISDHWTQSMLSHFVPAIQFIDEGRSKEEGVLVHCLAGISRSVTITMAYLMYKMGLSLNEAYDLVRAKKSNISPNFHFMGQLLDFERQLQSQFLSPPALGSSPDSGIEFDRWNSN